MSDLPPPPPPPGFGGPPPGYTAYGAHRGLQMGYAGFWIRFGAALVDGLILSIPMGLVTSMFDDNGTFYVGTGARPGATFTANLVTTVIGLLYYGLLEGGPTGQTLGKRICSIRVVDATTGQPGVGPGRGIVRYFARWLSSIALLLGYFWMLWDDRNQTWHDKLAKTVVVKV